MTSRRHKSVGSPTALTIGWVITAVIVVTVAGVAWAAQSAGHRAVSRKAPVARAASNGQPVQQSYSPPSLSTSSATALPATASSLATDHVRVCGNSTLLGGGPAAPPAGAIRIPAGNNSRVNWGRTSKTYWFAPGVHTFGTGRYSQIDPGAGSTYIGAPGAVLDGQHSNYYAFAGYAKNVTISYLTIRNFGTKGGNFDQGVVNVDSATNWNVNHSTIEDSGGAGAMLGSYDTLTYDCLASNGQYGFNAYTPRGPAHIVMENNEIAFNDTYNWEKHTPGCGCTGGGKFWDVNGAVVKGNWVHGNHSVGMWADTDNRGFDIEGNYFEGNYDVGLMYEISYNATISDNLFTRNALGMGPRNTGFPTPALYVSESGSDKRVAGKFGSTFQITGNDFVDNWSGVVLWENANRFCGSPYVGSTGYCTLVAPKVATTKACSRAHLSGSNSSRQPDYYDLCRWKTQNITVSANTFQFSPANIGASCTAAKGCGYIGLFSEYGSDPSWSPYQRTVVENHVTFSQNNHFIGNIYEGPWHFMAWSLGDTVGWKAWQNHFHQDATGTLSS